MKKLTFYLNFIFISVALTAQSAWTLQKDEDGIKVYTRKPANSDIFEFKATTNVQFTIEKFVKILRDASSYPKWISQVSFAKNIDCPSTECFIVYYKIGMPIGFKNRDIVLSNQIKKIDDKQIQIDLQTANDKYSLQKDCVRITNGYGFWNLQQIDTNQLQVTYQFYSDPKGSFPAWLINIFLVDGPYKTLQNLKTYIIKNQ